MNSPTLPKMSEMGKREKYTKSQGFASDAEVDEILKHIEYGNRSKYIRDAIKEWAFRHPRLGVVT